MNNTADSGGGIYIDVGSAATLADSEVCSNSVGQIQGTWSDGGGNSVDETCPSDCPGDIDGSGMVGGADLAIILGAWGPCP